MRVLALTNKDKAEQLSKALDIKNQSIELCFPEPNSLDVSSSLEHYLAGFHAFIIFPDAPPLVTFRIIAGNQYEELFQQKMTLLLEVNGESNPYRLFYKDMHAKTPEGSQFIKHPETKLYDVVHSYEDVSDKLNGFRQNLLDSVSTQAYKPAGTIPRCLYSKTATDNKLEPSFSVAVMGSFSAKDPDHIELGCKVGDMLYQNNWGLVYGGTDQSIMGAFAKAASGADHQGYVHAILPEVHVWGADEEEVFPFTDKVEIVADVQARKLGMYNQAQALLILFGGLGSADEGASFLHLNRYIQAQKPILFLDPSNHWKSLHPILKAAGYYEGEHYSVLKDVQATEDSLKLIAGA